MFGKLIDVDGEGNVLLQDKTMALMPALMKVYKHGHMGSKMVKWIVMVCDNQSPYRHLPLQLRKEEACFKVFEKRTHSYCERAIVKDAIDEYNGLQYDPLIEDFKVLRDTSYGLNKALRQLQKELSEETDKKMQNIITDEILKMQDKIGKSVIQRNKIKEMIIQEQKDGFNIQGVDEDDFSLFERDQMM